MKTLTLLIALLLVACSSSPPPAPLPGVTLTVENVTCDTACATIHVIAFPARQPAKPGWPWKFSIGALSTRYGCFTFPATDELVGVDATTPASASQQFIWTMSDSLALGADGGGAVRLVASTGAFVPATARGWLVKLPGAATPVPGAPCRT